jgi:hypothetical protein
MVYEPPAWVDRSMLPGNDAVPEAHTTVLDERRIETLWWPTAGEGGGGSSASPAHGRAFGDMRDASPDALIRNVYEGLELPGEPADYHFLIQGSAGQLWAHRREEPRVIGEVENLCWLDIRLVEAWPDAVRNQYSDEREFYGILSFGTLIQIYEREGFLAEALEVAELAARYGQGDEVRERLRQRIEAVESETFGDEQ